MDSLTLARANSDHDAWLIKVDVFEMVLCMYIVGLCLPQPSSPHGLHRVLDVNHGTWWNGMWNGDFVVSVLHMTGAYHHVVSQASPTG